MGATGLFHIANRRAARLLGAAIHELPEIEGSQIEVEFRPMLTAWRGKLLSRDARGKAVHAGSDIRKRRMVLDSQLLRQPQELERIFVHELYHFVWVRLGNPARWGYEHLAERQFAARGEMGWSAEGAKERITAADRKERTRSWREYVCESFCDSAAWMHSRLARHEEWTLAPKLRQERVAWFRRVLGGRRLLL